MLNKNTSTKENKPTKRLDKTEQQRHHASKSGMGALFDPVNIFTDFKPGRKTARPKLYHKISMVIYKVSATDYKVMM